MRWVCLWPKTVTKNNSRVSLGSAGSGHLSPPRHQPSVALPTSAGASVASEACQHRPALVQMPKSSLSLRQRAASGRAELPHQALLPPAMDAPGMFEVPQKMEERTKREGILHQGGLEDAARGRAVWSCAKDGNAPAVDRDGDHVADNEVAQDAHEHRRGAASSWVRGPCEPLRQGERKTLSRPTESRCCTMRLEGQIGAGPLAPRRHWDSLRLLQLARCQLSGFYRNGAGGQGGL